MTYVKRIQKTKLNAPFHCRTCGKKIEHREEYWVQGTARVYCLECYEEKD